MDLSKEHKFDYEASMISNGYLLNKKNVDRLVELRVRTVQVTLDGPSENHNKKRPLKNGQDSFSTILENIDYASTRLGVGVRVNVDQSFSTQIVAELLEELKARDLQRKIGVYFGQLEPSTSVCANIAESCFGAISFAGVETEYYRLLLENGFRVEKLPSPMAVFCLEPLKEGNWRALPPAEAVEQIMSAARRFEIRSVGIADACFGVRASWRHEFLSRLVEEQPPFWVIFETRPEYITEEDIRLLTLLKAEVQFGVESGSHRMLRLMHKSRSPAKFLDAFVRASRELSSRGIVHRANLLFNHPGETQASLEETFAFMDGCLGPEHSTLMWVPHSYMHFPGCEVYSERDRFEKSYGARFDCGDWWRGDTDQYEASMSLAPSASLDGENRELCWRMMEPRMEKMKQILTPQAFRFAANKYYPYWQDDHRYQNV